MFLFILLLPLLSSGQEDPCTPNPCGENTRCDSWQTAEQSILTNVLFTRRIDWSHAKSKITLYAVHPGAVSTELRQYYQSKVPSLLQPVTDKARLLLRTLEGEAQTTIYGVACPNLGEDTRKYYADCKRSPTSSVALDDKQAI